MISELLRSQVSGLDVAGQNASQGVDLIKTAEGALNEVSGLLRQMRDLAVDASSDSNKNDAARAALQSQVTSAMTTIDTIATNTKYAGRSLLDGSAGTDVSIIDNGTVVSSGITSLDTQSDGYISVQVTSASDTGAAVVAGNTVNGTSTIDLSGGNDVAFAAGAGLTISRATYGSMTLTEAAGTAIADYTDALYGDEDPRCQRQRHHPTDGANDQQCIDGPGCAPLFLAPIHGCFRLSTHAVYNSRRSLSRFMISHAFAW